MRNLFQLIAFLYVAIAIAHVLYLGLYARLVECTAEWWVGIFFCGSHHFTNAAWKSTFWPFLYIGYLS